MNGNKRIKLSNNNGNDVENLLRALKAVKQLPFLFFSIFPEYFPPCRSPNPIHPVKFLDINQRMSFTPNMNASTITINFFPQAPITIGIALQEVALVDAVNAVVTAPMTRMRAERLFTHAVVTASFIHIRCSHDTKMSYAVNKIDWVNGTVSSAAECSESVQSNEYIWRGPGIIPTVQHKSIGIAINISGFPPHCVFHVHTLVVVEGQRPPTAGIPTDYNFTSYVAPEHFINVSNLSSHLLKLTGARDSDLSYLPLKNPKTELFPLVDLHYFDEDDDWATLFPINK